MTYLTDRMHEFRSVDIVQAGIRAMLSGAVNAPGRLGPYRLGLFPPQRCGLEATLSFRGFSGGVRVVVVAPELGMLAFTSEVRRRNAVNSLTGLPGTGPRHSWLDNWLPGNGIVRAIKAGIRAEGQGLELREPPECATGPVTA